MYFSSSLGPEIVRPHGESWLVFTLCGFPSDISCSITSSIFHFQEWLDECFLYHHPAYFIFRSGLDECFIQPSLLYIALFTKIKATS